ncbi:hypothetical protein KDK95_30385 [Actinospica sp. MGRD01-02]|uniref:Uncharacterized protein n=1 Tax=Actinospica acidithermotolerans TaxID=2828514 RepID=A0A941EKA3_9ACTN|nr:hypothetical protein [Actinospica acidithermotolerans]MBR7830649.1 hypothetical protein [Actinospica acidithermotolerans]
MPDLTPPGGPGRDPARRARILQRLDQIGPGPKANYETLCALLDAPERFPSASMLIHHMVRELESALREVLREAPARDAQGGDEGTGNENHRREIEAIAATLSLDADVVTAWRFIVGRQHGWAHRHNLQEPDPVDQEVLDRVTRLEWVFDRVLEALADRYGLVHRRLRELLEVENPTKEHAAKLRRDFPQDPLTQEEFFENAGLEWLGPLHSAKAFTNPPDVVIEGDKYVSFPYWPAIAYLRRMAQLVGPRTDAPREEETAKAHSTACAKIVEIAKGVPATSNPRIGAELALIAQAVGPARAAKLAPRLVSALNEPYVIAVDVYADVAAALAAVGEHAGGSQILRAVLALGAAGEDRVPQPVMGDWEFAEVLRTHLPALTDAMGVKALEMFARMLDEAAGEAALARIWLPRVAQPSLTDSLADPRALLAAAVRDCAERLVGNQIPAEDVLAVLAPQPERVTARIRLHLLTLQAVADAVPEVVREAMADGALLHASWAEPEYLRLLREHAQLLTEQERAMLRQAIETGPDVGRWQRAAEEADGQPLPERVVALRQAQWRLNRYSAAEAILDEPGRAALERLVEEHGAAPFQRPPQPPMMLPVSPPVADAALAGTATARELAAAARAAAAPSQPMELFNHVFTLGRELRAAVDANATAYSRDAVELAGLDPYLVACALNGFTQAVSRGEVLDWNALLQLPAAIESDPGGDVAREAASLLHTAADRDALPAQCAAAAWTILLAGLAPAADAEPSETAEQRRAHAILALAAFARWAARASLDSQVQAACAELLAIDPDEVPHDVAAAFGNVLWTLDVLHTPGIRERMAGLKPNTAAFCGYLATTVASPLMKPVYRRALEEGLARRSDHDRLGSHLVALYQAGEIDLAPGGLAEAWWRHTDTTPAVAKDLAQLLVFPEPGPGETAERYNAFVDWRLAALAPSGGGTVTGEERLELLILAPLCLNTAPPGQGLARLRAVLEVTGELPTDPRLWGRLVEAMATEPTAVLQLLVDWAVRLDRRSVIPGRRDQQLRAIWRAGLDGGDPAQAALAERAINRAANAGFRQYLSLLPTSTDSEP